MVYYRWKFQLKSTRKVEVINLVDKPKWNEEPESRDKLKGTRE